MSTQAKQREVRGSAFKLEVREAGKDSKSPGTLTGYAAVFNTWSEDLGYFREMIRPGAFAKSLERGDDVRALVDHDSGRIVGRRSANTLRLSEDARGLKVEMDLPDTTEGRDLLESVKRGDLTGMSFGFCVENDTWSQQTVNGNVEYKRELIDIDLFEVSVVAWPAYADTSVEARAGGEVRSREQILEDGRSRCGKDAAPTRSNRERITKMWNARKLAWGVVGKG